MNARAPGDLLDGRYQLTERIGSGGMGTVFRAHDARLDRTVAIKLLHPGDVDDGMRARLQAEARFAGALQHPGIVQVFDYGEDTTGPQPVPYVVMQYVEGQPLGQILRERGALPPATVAAMLQDLAAALTVAHAAGIVHRDLKPSNILVTETGRAVLVDFGIARSDTAEPLTETGQILGSADYLSPEQVQGRRASAAADIYALGIVAYQCLSATSPFRRETPAATALARLQEDAPALGPDVPAAMRTLVQRMTAREPEVRPTAAEVAASAATLDQQPTVVLPPMAPAPARPARRWDRRRLVAVGAAAAIAMTIGGVLVVLGDDATPPAGASDLVVPSVEGRPVAKATRILEAAGFGVDPRLVDGPTEAGKVLHQSPAPGDYTGGDPATVRLRVASGWVELDDDELVGSTYDAARRALTTLGLTPRRVDRPSSSGVGTVLAVDDEGRLRLGSPVTLTVATTVVDTAPSPAKHHGRHQPKKHKPPKQKHKHGKPPKPGKSGKPGKKHH
ncbi:Protein kinase [Nocardioides sp. PD653]|nr:Protein kinase [Nocardioides sp. PD653-B2]GAW54936.1 Protein kinase [Nocardioides sp. PD653]